MDEQLEAAIEAAGRDRVFALVRGMGWGPDGAPKWVWYEAARKVANTPKTERE